MKGLKNKMLFLGVVLALFSSAGLSPSIVKADELNNVENVADLGSLIEVNEPESLADVIESSDIPEAGKVDESTASTKVEETQNTTNSNDRSSEDDDDVDLGEQLSSRREASVEGGTVAIAPRWASGATGTITQVNFDPLPNRPGSSGNQDGGSTFKLKIGTETVHGACYNHHLPHPNVNDVMVAGRSWNINTKIGRQLFKVLMDVNNGKVANWRAALSAHAIIAYGEKGDPLYNLPASNFATSRYWISNDSYIINAYKTDPGKSNFTQASASFSNTAPTMGTTLNAQGYRSTGNVTVRVGGTKTTATLTSTGADIFINGVDKGKSVTVTNGTVVQFRSKSYGAMSFTAKLSVKGPNILPDYVQSFQRRTNPGAVQKLVFLRTKASSATASLSGKGVKLEGKVKIVKKDASTGKLLSGAVFTIKNSGGTTVATLTTNTSGVATSANLPLGTYTVQEKTAPKNYVLNTNKFTAKVTHGTTLTVNVTNKAQTGKLVITKTGKTNGSKVVPPYSFTGAKFNILNASGTVVDTVTTGTNGKATTKALPIGTYKVRETVAPAGYLKAPDKSVNIAYGSQTVAVTTTNVSIVDTEQLGKIELTKTNEDGTKKLSGAKFNLYKGSTASGTAIATLTTSTTGVATSANLPLGEYSLKEVTAPTGYVLNTAIIKVTVKPTNATTAVSTIKVTAKNTTQKGKLVITKTGKTNGSTVVPPYSLTGAVFAIIDASGKTVSTVTTDATGKATTPNLELGTYTVRETKAPAGYLVAPDKKVTIAYASQTVSVQTINVSVVDTEQLGKIELTKTNEDETKKLVGAKFNLYKGSTASGTAIATLTTDTNGIATSGNLPLGDYSMKEVTAPNGYILDSTIIKVTVAPTDATTAVSTIKVTAKNTQQMGNINIVKTGKTNGSTVVAPYSLKGAEFDIVNSAGKVVDSITTDEAGKAKTKDLALGKYTIKETKAPYGYLIASPVEAELVYGGQSVTIVSTTAKVVDVEQLGKIKLVKTNNDGSKVLSGAVYELFKGTEATGTPIQTLTTDATGVAVSNNLPLGDYCLKEKTAPVGYLISDEVTTVKVLPKDASTAVTEVGVTIKDEAQKGKLIIDKYGKEYGKTMPSANYSLKGAEFSIIDSANKVVATLVTDAKGLATSEALPLGKYIIRETKAPVGYSVAEDINVEIKYTNQTEAVSTTTVKVVDAEKKASLKLYKYMNYNWENGSTNPFTKPGIEFTLYSGTKVVGVKGTNDKGEVIFDNLPFGKYTLEETKAPIGYMPVATVEYNLTEENPNGEMALNIENKVMNYRNMAVKKVDADTGKIIPSGAMTFKVKNLNTGKYVVINGKDEFATESGIFVLETNLPYGDYQIEEVKAPAGYVKGEPKKFSLKGDEFDGVIQTYSDKRVKGKITITKNAEHVDKFDDVFNVVNNHPLEGVKFGIYARTDIIGKEGTKYHSKDELIQEVVSNDKGLAVSKELELGSYYIKELSAPAGYVLDTTEHDVVVNTEDDSQAVVNFEDEFLNKLQVVNMSLVKTSERNIPIANSEWEIRVAEAYNQQGLTLAKDTLIKTLKTDANGKIAVSMKMPFGLKLYAVEKQAPTGYYNPQTKYPFEYNATTNESSVNIAISSKPVVNKDEMFTVKGTKTGEAITDSKDVEKDGYTIKEFIRGEVKLKDVVFDIYSVGNNNYADGNVATTDGQKVDTVTTNSDGFYESKKLTLGNYRLEEVSAPVGNIMLKDSIPFTGKYANQTVELTHTIQDVQNTIQNVDIEGHKISDDNKPLKGVVFGLYANEDISYNGKLLVSKDELVNVSTTNEDGLYKFNQYLPVGKYYIQEIQTIDGYVINRDKIEIEYNKVNNDDTHKITVTDALVNKAQRYTLNLTKLGEIRSEATIEDSEYGDLYTFNYKDGNISGSEFDLYAKGDIYTNDGTKQHSANELIEHLVVGEDGKVTTEHKLHLGSYYIVETKASEGYTLMTEPIEFTLEYLGQEVELGEESVSGKNLLQTYQVNVHKEDEVVSGWEANEPIISTEKSNGKVFGLYTGEKIDEVPADSLVGIAETKDGIASFEALKLPFSHNYYVKELKTDDSHDILKEHYTFKVLPFTNNVAVKADVYEDKTVYSSEKSESFLDKIADLFGKNTRADADAEVLPEDEFKDAISQMEIDDKGNIIADIGTEGQPLVNKLHQNEVRIKKFNQNVTGQTKDGIRSEYVDGSGVTFGVFTEDDVKLIEGKTGEDGYFVANNLPVGTYIIKELKAKDDTYQLGDTWYKVVITKEDVQVFNKEGEKVSTRATKDGDVSYVTYVDTEVKVGENYVVGEDIEAGNYMLTSKFGRIGKVVINDDEYKYVSGLESNNVELVDGDVITVIDALAEQNGEGTEDSTEATTDSSEATPVSRLGEAEGVEDSGENEVEEPTVEEPEGNEDGSTIDDGKFNAVFTQAIEPEDGDQLADTELTTDTLFRNNRKQGWVEISKVDVTNQKELPGAYLEIEDADGNVIINWVSSDKPYKFQLLEGEYTLRETIAPKGYRLSTKEVKFSIKDGEITHEKFENTPKVAKTGNNLTGYTVAIIALAVVAVASGVVIYTKRKK